MCILLLSTAHPDYPLILLNNRDEFLHRATQAASFWEPPYGDILGGRDLARSERGTWLGVTRAGRLAVLTNFREPSSAAAIGERSRGAMVTSFLKSDRPSNSSTKDWLHKLLLGEEMKGVGGFSMLCGTLRPNQGGNLEELVVVSNRTEKRDDGIEETARWIGGEKGKTYGLSNSLFTEPWEKVHIGCQLLSETIADAAESRCSEDELLENLFTILSHDTLPVDKENDTYETELEALRHSVFIPAFVAAKEHPSTPPDNMAGSSTMKEPTADAIASGIPERLRGTIVNTSADDCGGECAAMPKGEQWRENPRLYGTQKQTLILVDRDGRLKFVERTLYDGQAKPVVGAERDVSCEFQIDGWSSE